MSVRQRIDIAVTRYVGRVPGDKLETLPAGVDVKEFAAQALQTRLPNPLA